MTSRNLLQKHAWLHKLPLHQNHRYTNIPPTSLGQFFRVTWNAASRAIVLIFPEYSLTCNCHVGHFLSYVSTANCGSFLAMCDGEGKSWISSFEVGSRGFLSGGCPWVCSHRVSTEGYTAAGQRLARVSTRERHGIRMEQMRYLRALNVLEEPMLLNR